MAKSIHEDNTFMRFSLIEIIVLEYSQTWISTYVIEYKFFWDASKCIIPLHKLVSDQFNSSTLVRYALKNVRIKLSIVSIHFLNAHLLK